MIHIKQTKAFTMIELIMVIIVLGILASLAMPRLERDLRQEAADSILSDIRYTQHLALMDDMHEFDNPQWQRKFWRIGFESCAGNSGIYEYIGSDSNMMGGINNNESATDPQNGKKMIWSGANCSNGGDNNTSANIFISKKYSVTAVAWGGSCINSQYIGFDHLGRMHQVFTGSTQPNYSSYLATQCIITFTLENGDTFSINIAPETGYAHIVNQDDS